MLLLDEPTNHLDTETIDGLIDGLRAFEGTLILVSHDRYFIESLASHVLVSRWTGAFTGGGNAGRFSTEGTHETHSKNDADVESYEARKKQQRELKRKKKRIAQIEQLVQTKETGETLNEALMEVAEDYQRANELADALRAIESEA